MKYIRTKDGRIGKVISVRDYNGGKPTFYHVQFKNDKEIYSDYELNIIAQADTIEELCDAFVSVGKDNNRICHLWNELDRLLVFERGHDTYFYGAIWTDKGLIYVAKMNDKGELELL